MRRVVLAAVCATIFAAIASSQEAQFGGPPALRLMLCGKVPDSAARLKCFDDALIVLQQPVKQAEEAETAPERSWDVNESKSPIDDSPQVTAALFAEKARGGIIFRCRERQIDGQYMPDRFINTRDSIQGLFRINSDKPVEVRWSGSTTGRSAFFNNAAAFLRSLPDDGKLFMRAIDFQGATYDSVFNLGKVSEVRTRIFAACAAGAGVSKKPAATKQ